MFCTNVSIEFSSIIFKILFQLWKSKVYPNLSFSESLSSLAFVSSIKLCQFGFIVTFATTYKCAL